MPPPASPFDLTPSDLITLQGWMRMSTLGQTLVERARILLLLADGMTPKAVSEQLQITRPTVFKCMRPAKSSTQPRKAKTWCALKFKWAPVLAF